MHLSKLLNIYKQKYYFNIRDKNIHYKLLQNTNIKIPYKIPYKIPLLKSTNTKFNTIFSESKNNKNLKIIFASTITSIVSSITLYHYLMINNVELLFIIK